MKKLFIFLFLLPLTSYAEMCPNLNDIKHNHFPGWTAYDSEDGTPLTPKQLSQFRHHIEKFALAEWQPAKTKGQVMHCYYKDKYGSELEAYLAKPDLTPDNSHNRWYSVSGSMHCAAEQELCAFKSPTTAIAANWFKARLATVQSFIHRITSPEKAQLAMTTENNNDTDLTTGKR